MNNIEKFESLKELNRLKAELHKHEITTFFTLERYQKKQIRKHNGIFKLTKFGYTIFNLVQFFLKNKAKK